MPEHDDPDALIYKGIERGRRLGRRSHRFQWRNTSIRLPADLPLDDARYKAEQLIDRLFDQQAGDA